MVTILVLLGVIVGVLVVGAALIFFFGPSNVRFDTSVELTVDRQIAFAVFMDFPRWVEFWNVGSVDPPEPPIAVGSTFTFTEKRGAVVAVDITAWEPGKLFRADLDFTAADLGQAFEIRYEDAGTGSRIVMVNDGQLGNTIYKVLMPVMKPFAKRYYRSVLGRVRTAAEAEPDRT